MTAPFPQTLSDLQTYVSNQINDPTNTRYSIALINQQLDIAQNLWNMEALICRATVIFTSVAGQQVYPISNLTGTIIKPLRVTFKGIALVQRSKYYFDLFSARDWTTDQGTPRDYYLDINQTPPVIGLHPTPQGNDAGLNVGFEYLLAHQQMVNPTDTPFTSPVGQNTLITPFLYGLGLECAAAILEPDPTAETVKKASIFRAQANAVRSAVVQLYQELEQDEPMRMQGGRSWNVGSAGMPNPS